MRITFNTNNISTHKFNLNQVNSFGVINPFEQKKDKVEISFKANGYCSTQSFEIKNLKNLRCPVCGLVMLSEDQIASFVNDVGNKKGQALIDTLEKYEDESVVTGKPSQDDTGLGIYRPYKKQVVNIYIDLAKKYPNLDLLGLTKLQAQKCIDELIEEQLIVINELKAFVEKEYQGDAKKALNKKIKNYTDQIKGKKQDPFSRKKFIFDMKKGLDNEQAAKMDEITTKMPTSENDINSFFVHYQRAENAKEIAKKFVQQTRPTAEHVVPRAAGGADNLSNYFCDCEDCNSKRGTTTFYEWYKSIPSFADRLQDYLDTVRVAIDDEMFEDSNYDGYIENFVETILDVSEGEIILEVPEVKNPKKRETLLKIRNRQIANLRSKHGSLVSIRNQIQAEIEKLKSYEFFESTDMYRRNLEELSKIEQERKEIEGKLIALRPLIFQAKRELQEVQNVLANKKNSSKKGSLQIECDKKQIIVVQLEGQAKQLKEKDNELRKRVINLRIQSRPVIIREDELTRKYEAIRVVKAKLDELSEKIAKLGDIYSKEASLTSKTALINDGIDELRAKNEIILNLDGFNPNDDSLYKQYIEQNELLKTGERMEWKKNTVNNALAAKFVEQAKKATRQEILRLEKSPYVQYFINQNILKTLLKEKEVNQIKLDEILETKKQVQQLQEQVEILCKGKTPDEIQREYDLLSSEKRVVFDIHNVKASLDRLARLNKIIETNEECFDKLQDVGSLSNSQYAALISFVEVSEPF